MRMARSGSGFATSDGSRSVTTGGRVRTVKGHPSACSASHCRSLRRAFVLFAVLEPASSKGIRQRAQRPTAGRFGGHLCSLLCLVLEEHGQGHKDGFRQIDDRRCAKALLLFFFEKKELRGSGERGAAQWPGPDSRGGRRKGSRGNRTGRLYGTVPRVTKTKLELNLD